ncbi:ribonucleoprotein RB97D-like isoform X1 [Musca domestica]|uniref:RNA recognition protein n=1 Tax=Musca domestica TaxID=7370 RepID=T1PJ50_MUSDO|nr:ribonucleoprotein RB97D-like isoform X1 [Musca domestica]
MVVNKSVQSNAEGDNLRKLFLGGLSANSTEDSLRKFYQQFGEVIDITVRRDPTTGRSRGFGFVTFADASCVDKAQAARPHVVDGKTVDSKRVIIETDQKTKGSGRKIFVGGLKAVHDEDLLRQHFQQFGKILGIKVLIDRNTGRNRGFAYVEFEDYDAADKAVAHQNHVIKYLRVDVKKSNYKPDPSKFQNQNGYTGYAGGAPASTYPPPTYAAPYGYPPPAYGAPAWGAPPPPGAPGAYPPQQQAAPAGYPQQPPPAYGAPPTWNGWGYGAPPAAVPPQTAQPPVNGWNNAAAPPPANQPFGNYQQSYNGGPEKTGRLQTNRMAPYKS